MFTNLIRILPLLALLASFVQPLVTQTARAHDVRPAYLQIEPLAADRYTLIWRTPVLSGAPLPVALDLPPQAIALSEARRQNMPGTTVERLAVEIPGGIDGERIGFIGLEGTITDVLVRIKQEDGSVSTTLVRPSRPWIDIQKKQNTLQVAGTFLIQGIEHILFGFDHLLFVAALMLIVRNWLVLVKTITAFTIAHSITLTCATLGWIALPSGPVEIMIAFSILLVAAEILAMERGRSSLTISSPWIVAFAFGLLHGFGFAGALQEIGLPQGDIPLALFFFNAGVEIGQLLFVGAILLVLAALKKVVRLPRRSISTAAYAIGIIASFWTIERLYGTFA
ncbi:HupE/UreJ family protein [Roseibium sp. M-1]